MKLIKSKKLLKISAAVLSLVLLCGAMSATVSAAAAFEQPTSGGVPDVTIESILQKTINWAISLISLVSIVFIIYAGIKWIMSEGDDTKQKEARKMLATSVTGLVIALAAYAIVRVVASVFGINY